MGKYIKQAFVATKPQQYFNFQPTMKRAKIIDSVEKLKKLAAIMKNVDEFAFDTETNTLRVYGENKSFKCVCITISWGAYHNYYIPLEHARTEDYKRNLPLKAVQKYLKPIFENPDLRLIGQNIKFDMHVLARRGIYVQTNDLWDTAVMSWLCDENTPNGLKENSGMKLGIDQSHFAEVVKTVPNEVKKEFGIKAASKATYDLVLIKDGAQYALPDSYYTWELYLGFLDLLDKEKMTKIYTRSYQPFLRCLFNMEERGVTVDVKKLKQLAVDIKQDIEDLEYKMFERVGVEFNPGSNTQLAELFFAYEKPAPTDKNGNPRRDKKGNLIEANRNQALLDVSFGFRPIHETAKGAPATSEDVFWRISQMQFKNKHKQNGVEVAKILMKHSKLKKLQSAFIEGLIVQTYDDGKAHPSFNIIGTDSGRLSCSSPNLQQLPKAGDNDKYQIRSLFIGSPDPTNPRKNKKLIASDFSNLEMRVLAHFSEDKNLLKMFAEGADTHGSTAVNMFNLDCDPAEVKKHYPHLRQAAKVINFLLMYGGGAQRLYEQLKADHESPIDLGAPEYLEAYKCKNGLDVAQLYIDKYFDTYSGVAKFIRDQKKFAKRNGYVQTLLRRKRRLPEINSSNFGMKSYFERIAVNATIQGSAADITSSAQNRVDKDPWFIEHDCLMLLQVHDELVFECPEQYVEEAMQRIKDIMAHPFGEGIELNVELQADADSGDSYQEAK